MKHGLLAMYVYVVAMATHLSSIYGDLWVPHCPVQSDPGLVLEWRLLCPDLEEGVSMTST